MQVACPQCRAPLQLMVQALPSRAACPHCRTVFTINPSPAPSPVAARPAHIPIPARPAPAPMPSPRVPAARLPTAPPGSGKALRVGIALSVLGVFLVAGIFLVSLCFREDAPTAQGSPQPGVLPVSGPAAPPVDPVVEKRRKRIKEAIARGVDYLKSKFDTDTFRTPYMIYPSGDTGISALAGLTLLECGVSKKDPVITRLTNRVRGEGRAIKRTYTLALSILFLDRLEDPADKDLIRDLALTLVSGQTTSGGWGYLCPALSQTDRENLLLALRGQGAVPAAALPKQGLETNSNTQFAVLGLWAARKHKIPVEQALAQVDGRFRAQQQADGSWGYQPNRHIFRDSMTCAGLLALGVGRGLDKGPAGKGPAGKMQDLAIEKALRYLAVSLKRLSPVAEAEKQARLQESERLDELTARWPKITQQEMKEINQRIPGQLAWRGALVNSESMGDLYFLWSVERVAVLYDLKTIGDFDWYAWGSDILLDNQKADGGWRERIPGIPDTCFALLFLARANLVKDLTDRLQGALGLAADLGTRNNPNDRKAP
jgi:hypothetical protein